MEQTIQFNQGFIILKEGAKPFDTETMSGFKFFAKVMMNKGTKVSESNTIDDFQTSRQGNTYIAELICEINGKQISLSDRCFCHINKPAKLSFSNCWFVSFTLADLVSSEVIATLEG